MKKVLFFIFLIIFELPTYARYDINIDFFSKFNDCYLDKYINMAISNNHEILSVIRKVKQFRYEINNKYADELPQLRVSGNYLGSHFPNGDVNILIDKNSFILPFQMNWELDLLLKTKDKINSTKKIYNAELANLKGCYISLLSDVANGYINILLYDYLTDIQKLIVQDAILNAQKVRNKYNAGISDLITLNNSINSVKAQKTTYINMLKNQKTALYAFSVLIGESPENMENIKRNKLSGFDYHDKIPNEVSSDVIYSRPDIVEIENRLKSAKIDVTVAKKDFFPTFNITGALVFDTAGHSGFFSWDSSFAYLIAGATQNIFMGGRKIADFKIKKEKYNELVEQYKQKDLIAIKEINNALNLIKEDKISEENLKLQLELEQQNFNKTDKKLKKGIISEIDFIQKRNSLYQRKQLYGISKALRLTDCVTLYKAVGGQL